MYGSVGARTKIRGPPHWGPITDSSIANGDVLPTVSDGAQDAFTQDTKAGSPRDQTVELTQKQLTDDSKKYSVGVGSTALGNPNFYLYTFY